MTAVQARGCGGSGGCSRAGGGARRAGAGAQGRGRASCARRRGDVPPPRRAGARCAASVSSVGSGDERARQRRRAPGNQPGCTDDPNPRGESPPCASAGSCGIRTSLSAPVLAAPRRGPRRGAPSALSEAPNAPRATRRSEAQAAGRYRTPQTAVAVSPSSSQRRPSPVARALAGAVIGSAARASPSTPSRGKVRGVKTCTWG